ncbi:hypothetical protein [Candidatus Parabeggiatoa sp. HSG14]|uniref:hypothetical protein n=1 Tax=Candidatus Parabeggiatoa sp. HSG14 TaxID=3055593 RepID=UPI0032E50F79
MSNTVYHYVKSLIGNEKIENWRNVCQWLEGAGYKKTLQKKPSPNNPVLLFLPLCYNYLPDNISQVEEFALITADKQFKAYDIDILW